MPPTTRPGCRRRRAGCCAGHAVSPRGGDTTSIAIRGPPVHPNPTGSPRPRSRGLGGTVRADRLLSDLYSTRYASRAVRQRSRPPAGARSWCPRSRLARGTARRRRRFAAVRLGPGDQADQVIAFGLDDVRPVQRRAVAVELLADPLEVEPAVDDQVDHAVLPHVVAGVGEALGLDAVDLLARSARGWAPPAARPACPWASPSPSPAARPRRRRGTRPRVRTPAGMGGGRGGQRRRGSGSAPTISVLALEDMDLDGGLAVHAGGEVLWWCVRGRCCWRRSTWPRPRRPVLMPRLSGMTSSRRRPWRRRT